MMNFVGAAASSSTRATVRGYCIEFGFADVYTCRRLIDLSLIAGTDPSQTFTYNPTTFELILVGKHECVDVHSGGPIVWMYGCSTSSANDQLKFDKTAGTVTANKLCFGVEADNPGE